MLGVALTVSLFPWVFRPALESRGEAESPVVETTVSDFSMTKNQRLMAIEDELSYLRTEVGFLIEEIKSFKTLADIQKGSHERVSELTDNSDAFDDTGALEYPEEVELEVKIIDTSLLPKEFLEHAGLLE